jgi:hypothetical protein
MCIYGLLHAADPNVQWYWTVGHLVVLAGCAFLIGKVWASLKGDLGRVSRTLYEGNRSRPDDKSGWII